MPEQRVIPEQHSVIVLPRWAPAERILRVLTGALEGRHAWGYFEVAASSRGAWMRERLVLLPPGIPAWQRRVLTVSRHVPVVGACLAIVATIVIGGAISPIFGFGVAFGLYAVAIWAGVRATAEIRRDSIQLEVLTVSVNGSVESYGNVESLSTTRTGLARVDAQLRAGRLSRGEHALDCAALFWALDAERSRLASELRQHH